MPLCWCCWLGTLTPRMRPPASADALFSARCCSVLSYVLFLISDFLSFSLSLSCVMSTYCQSTVSCHLRLDCRLFFCRRAHLCRFCRQTVRKREAPVCLEALQTHTHTHKADLRILILRAAVSNIGPRRSVMAHTHSSVKRIAGHFSSSPSAN